MTTVKAKANPDYGPEVHDREDVRMPAPNARQGVIGHNVRYVLTISLATVIAVFLVVYYFFFLD